VAYAIIGATDRAGVNVRRFPGYSAVIVALRDGAQVQVLGQRSIVDDIGWVRVVLPDGRTGWVAETYLIPYVPFGSFAQP